VSGPDLDGRERRILAVAREYIGIDGAEIGATPGERVWRSGDAGAVRRHFLTVVGRIDLPDRRPPRMRVQLEFQLFGSGRMKVSGEVRTRDELRMALRAFGEPVPFILGKDVPLSVTEGGRSVTDLTELMPERRPPRRREKESFTLARTLTLHYLSRAGGGTRTLAAAASLWEAQGWPLPAGWTSAHYRTIGWIRKTLGEL